MSFLRPFTPKKKSALQSLTSLPLLRGRGQTNQIFQLTPLEQRVLMSNNVSINFQPDSSDRPTGYLADNGAAYADRGNGYSYGWMGSSTPADNTAWTRDRNNATSPDHAMIRRSS